MKSPSFFPLALVAPGADAGIPTIGMTVTIATLAIQAGLAAVAATNQMAW